MRWYELLVAVFAAAGALGAWAAARATKRAAEGQILLELLSEYATPEMAEALVTLRAWKVVKGEAFASEWATARDEPAGQAVDRARRYVTSYFQNTDQLWQIGLISKRTTRAAVDKAGLAVLLYVCVPLERKLNPRVNSWVRTAIGRPMSPPAGSPTDGPSGEV